MGKTVRKYRKNRSYDFVPPAEKASPYLDGKGTHHVDGDLLSSPREFVPLDQLAPGHASPLRVVLTLMASSLGATVVVLPYAVLQGGFVMSIFIVLFVSLVTHLTRTRLVELGVEQGIYSFQGLAKLAFGPLGGFTVSATQLGASLGLIITYLAIAFQDIPIVIGHWLKMDFDADGRPIVTPGTRVSPFFTLLADRYWFPEAFTLFVLLPYCVYANSYKRMRLSPALILAALVAATYSAIAKAKSDHDANVSTTSQGYDRDYLHVPSTVCQGFAIITMAILNQHHSFHAFYAMHDRSTTTFNRLSFIATLGSLMIALGISIAGYVAFLDSTKSDVIRNYDFANNRLMLFFWTAVPFTAVIGVGFEVIVSRHTMQFLLRPSTHVDEEKQDVLFASQNVSKTSGATDHLHYEEEHSAWTSSFLTALVLLLVVQVPIFCVSDVAVVLSLTGGLAGISLCFILPAACQLRLSSPTNWCSDHVLPCLSITIGVVAAIAAVISTVVHMEHHPTPTTNATG